MLPSSGTVATSYTINIYVLARHRELVTSLNSAKKTIIKQICTTIHLNYIHICIRVHVYVCICKKIVPVHVCVCMCMYPFSSFDENTELWASQ